MRKQLAEIIPAHPEEVEVQVCCRKCGRALGTYPFSGDLLTTDQGQRFVVRPQPRRVARPGRKRSRTGAARFTSEISPDGHYTTLNWRCGPPCEAKPQRRSDRLGRLEFLVEDDLPTVWI